MTDYRVDMSGFPLAWHRIVKSWYSWREIYLREMGRYPGKDRRKPRGSETAAQVFWGGRPPVMINDGELKFLDDSELANYLVFEDNQYYIDGQERGSRSRYFMFRRFEDAEKYTLFLISQMARIRYYKKSPGFRWYQEGVHPWVTLDRPDPVNFPGRVSLTVDDETNDRGWVPETDAAAAAHVLVLSFEELDTVLREGIPVDWFSTNVLGS